MTMWESLVEANIVAIRFDPIGKSLCMEFTCPWRGNSRMRMLATGIDDFLANEMRLSNIVDRVRVFTAKDICGESSEVASSLFFLMRGNAAVEEMDWEWPALKEALASIQRGELCLMEIEPVYGSTIQILAREFLLEPIE